MSFPFKIPFASTGEQTTVPDTSPDGFVNFTQGYTPDYKANPATDPNAKLVEMGKFNYLLNKITSAIGEIQRKGSAAWYSALAPYELNAEVVHAGKKWRSAIANNSSTPGANTDWLDVTPGTVAKLNTGTGANDVPTNSDLGTASKADVGTPAEIAAGDANVLATGAGVRSTLGGYGIGGFVAEKAFVDLNLTRGGFFGIPSSDPDNPAAVSPLAMHAQASAAFGGGLLFDRNINPRGWLYSVREGIVYVKEIWSKGNTTIDSNGFIKQASPIINLFSDRIEPNESLEVASAEFERVNVGHYVIRNVPKLSRNGWYIETPKDRNNNIYFTIDYDESVEGELTIRTYEPDYSTGRAANGAPMDIIEGRFVALRFEEKPELYPVIQEQK